MSKTIDVKINAANANIPLAPLYAFKGSPTSPRVINVPKKIGSWCLTKVYATAALPDNAAHKVEMVNVAGCYVGTIPPCDVAGVSSNGFTVSADGTDENGRPFSGYVLGRGDLIVLDRDLSVLVGKETYFLHFFDEPPTTPHKGDMCVIGGALKWWDGKEWGLFGAGGDMSHSEFVALPAEDLDPDKVGFPEICKALNSMKNLLRPAAIVAALCLVCGASAPTSKLSALKGASSVVTSVSFDGLATSAEVAAATNAAASAAKGYADGATNAVATALRGEIAPVRAKAESALQPAATNGIPESLASQASSLSSLSSTVSAHTAAKSNPHGVTAAQVGAYTKAEIDAKGYVTEAVTNGLADATWVDALAAEVAGKASAANVYTKSQADAKYYPADEGALWASWWSGDGFRVVVSNYDVSATAAWDRLPAAAFEYRPGGTGDLVRVWDERTRWARHRIEFADFQDAMDAALAEKADLDWGKTTPTGFDSPDGFTWLDTPAVAVAGGLAWQKTITSEGAIWLLCSNGMVAEFGSSAASTNGYFRITDERGETAFEIVQGDRRTVGANPESVYTWTAADGKTHLRVVYNVVSDAAPTLRVADALKPGGGTVWKAEGADGCPAQFAGWTGSSGAWTNALWRTSAPAAGETDALFCYATYEQGGETVVKNHAPVALSKLVLGGVTYTVGTAEISGHTVLTLTPQGGN